MRIALTDLAIRQLQPPERGQLKVWDTQLPGFGMVIGKRSRTFTVVTGTERRNQSIGRYPDMSLKTARTEAKRLLATPSAKRSVKRLRELATAYLEDCAERLRPSSYRRFAGILTDAPDMLIADATKSLATTAHEVAAYKAMFNWGIREGYAQKNPFAFVTARYGQRSRVLTPDELKAIWHYDHPPFSDIVKLLILTGMRRGEASRIEPSWITGDLLTIPANVAKNGREHTLPIGPLTNMQLVHIPYTFNGWGKSKARMDKHTGVSDYVLHDIRRTYATLHAEIGTPVVVTEKLLNHVSGTQSGIVAVYQRHHYLAEMKTACLNYEQHLRTILAL